MFNYSKSLIKLKTKLSATLLFFACETYNPTYSSPFTFHIRKLLKHFSLRNIFTVKMAKFESIFKSSDDVDPNLNKLFTRKLAPKKKNIEDLIFDLDENIDETDEPKTKRPKKLSPETEKRTIFVGNLNNDCKKEVPTTSIFLIVIIIN